MMKTKLLPPNFLQIILALQIILHFTLPLIQVIHYPWRLLGIPLVLAGIAINIWADQLFKKRQTQVKPYDTPLALVVDGPFRFTRHPMYLGMMVGLAGVAVILGSLATFWAPVAFVTVAELFYIPHEEENMAKEFGEDYAEYCRRVRRWL